MIIRCESCGTRYNLPEEKIKPGGMRVRCARCRSMFMVFPSSLEELPELEIFSDEFAIGDEPGPGAEPVKKESEGDRGRLLSDEARRSFPEEAASFDSDEFNIGGGDIPASSFPRQDSAETPPREPDFDFSAASEGLSMEGERRQEEGSETGEVVEEDFSPAPPLPSQEERREPIDLVRPEGSRKGPSLIGRLLLVLVLLVAAVAGGLAGYIYWSGESMDVGRLMGRLQGGGSPSGQAEGRIHLTHIEGFFVMNRDAGRLFVIRGQAVNEFPGPRGAISVKGVLYDTTGKPITQKIAYCGNPLDSEALRTLPLRRIEESMKNQFGADFSNLTTAPGKSIPFTVVFQNVPDKLAEFSVDVNDSSPVSGDR
ncbi:MAG: DUF3426 domain-containing protein [Desulfuromonadaceae bacterium]|nr:DUF3426 domain-containing protein [Desulfuromonadaceae bacterium]